MVVDEDLRAAADLAAEPDEEAVGVGRRNGELPVAEAEALGHQLADGAGILARQHRRDPALGLRGDRGDGRRRGMPAHRAGVAEAEIDVGVAVDVGHLGAARRVDVDREAPRPARHPVHRHPGEEVRGGGVMDLARARVQVLEPLLLALEELPDPFADGADGHLPHLSVSVLSSNCGTIYHA